MVLSFFDTIEMILSDWHNTNIKSQKDALPDLLPNPTVYSFWQSKYQFKEIYTLHVD